MKRIKTITLIFLIILPGLGFVFQDKYLTNKHLSTDIPPRLHAFPGEPVIYSPSGDNIVLYEKQTSLAATMKFIQTMYSQWQTIQLQSLGKIREGAIYTTGLVKDGSPELRSPSVGVFDKDAKRPDGSPIWELAKESGQKDLFLSGNTAGRDQTAFLAWVTESNEPCELGIGIYGGDQMTVWLNGKKIFEKTNVFDFPDYWWHHEKNFVRNDSRMNQSIVNIPYYGSYFGRRNIRHIDHPDFRPVPDLTEARGTLKP